MIVMLMAGAGYAYYQKTQQDAAANKYPLDPELSLEGKSSIEFLPHELKSGLLSNSITTITFYKGNYHNIRDQLEQRVKDVLQLNPWLGGWLAQKPGDTIVKLWYDSEGNNLAPSIFTVFEPGEIPLKRDTQYVQYKDICTDFAVKVPMASQLIGRNVPIWKVTIIPDAVVPFKRFAVVVSQSHYIGDNYTYYRLVHMLNPASSVEALNPVRHPDFREQVQKHMGAEEAFYFEKATPDILDQMIESYYKRQQQQISNDDQDESPNKIETLLFTVSKEWLEYQTQQAVLEETRCHASSKTDSQEDNESFSSLPAAHVILSWWYNMSNADIGMYPHQLRNDLPEILSTNDAGNYNNPIPYTPADYATPQLFRDSIRTGRRCGISPETGQMVPLPKITTGKSFAFGVDWNKHFSKGIYHETEGIEEDLHIPFLTAEELCVCSTKMSCCLLFTAQTGKIDESTGENDDSQRIGVFVVAKKEICDRILASGIVDQDMKTNLTEHLANKRGSILEFDALPALSIEVDLSLEDKE